MACQKIIREISSELHQVNELLKSYVQGQTLSLEDKIVISSFYSKYNDTNTVLDYAESAMETDTDTLYSDSLILLGETNSLISLYKSSKAILSSFDTVKDYELNIRIFDDEWKAEANKANAIWQELSVARNHLESLFWGSGLNSSDLEYAALEKKCDDLLVEYNKKKTYKEELYDKYQKEIRRTAFLSFFKIGYVYALTYRLDSIAKNLVSIISDSKKGGNT